MEPNEIESIHNEAARTYIKALLPLVALSGIDELNFVKKTLEMPDGGIYLLQLQHVMGPKINLKEIFPMESKEKTDGK
jgi:hypothetical protein